VRRDTELEVVVRITCALAVLAALRWMPLPDAQELVWAAPALIMLLLIGLPIVGGAGPVRLRLVLALLLSVGAPAALLRQSWPVAAQAGSIAALLALSPGQWVRVLLLWAAQVEPHMGRPLAAAARLLLGITVGALVGWGGGWLSLLVWRPEPALADRYLLCGVFSGAISAACTAWPGQARTIQ
jgi:hypothetical protein